MKYILQYILQKKFLHILYQIFYAMKIRYFVHRKFFNLFIKFIKLLIS